MARPRARFPRLRRTTPARPTGQITPTIGQAACQPPLQPLPLALARAQLRQPRRAAPRCAAPRRAAAALARRPSAARRGQPSHPLLSLSLSFSCSLSLFLSAKPSRGLLQRACSHSPLARRGVVQRARALSRHFSLRALPLNHAQCLTTNPTTPSAPVRGGTASRRQAGRQAQCLQAGRLAGDSIGWTVEQVVLVERQGSEQLLA